MSEFFLEFVVPFLVFFVLRSLLRSVFAGLKRPVERPSSGPTSRPAASGPVRAGGTLHKDPVCGTYVSEDAGIAQSIKGQVVYFCSPECRDRYRPPAA
jgi:YHS domain-containing protein